jgi:hypothetical protein
MGISNEGDNALIARRKALHREFPPGTSGRKAWEARREIDQITQELRDREDRREAAKRKGGH